MGQNKMTHDSNTHDEERNTTGLWGDKNAGKPRSQGKAGGNLTRCLVRETDAYPFLEDNPVALKESQTQALRLSQVRPRRMFSGLTPFPFASCIWDVNT